MSVALAAAAPTSGRGLIFFLSNPYLHSRDFCAELYELILQNRFLAKTVILFIYFIYLFCQDHFDSIRCSKYCDSHGVRFASAVVSSCVGGEGDDGEGG